MTLTINHLLKINENNIELIPTEKAINFYKNYGFKYVNGDMVLAPDVFYKKMKKILK